MTETVRLLFAVGRERLAEACLELALKLVFGSETGLVGQQAEGLMLPFQKIDDLLEPDIDDLLKDALAGCGSEALLRRSPGSAENRQDVRRRYPLGRMSPDEVERGLDGRHRALEASGRKPLHEPLRAVCDGRGRRRLSVHHVRKELPGKVAAAREVRLDARQ